MSRRLIYTFSLAGFFLMWGVFGLAGITPRSEPLWQATLPAVESTPVNSGATATAGQIPVTGGTRPGVGTLFVYGILGLAGLILVLALLNAVNKPITPDLRRKEPPDKPSGN